MHDYLINYSACYRTGVISHKSDNSKSTSGHQHSVLQRSFKVPGEAGAFHQGSDRLHSSGSVENILGNDPECEAVQMEWVSNVIKTTL